ncbi:MULTISPECIES: hypothetical protein [Henriciella]|uniref:hypothetical protein n=1 Tax=Henriciella TaxID=453849 RepID=UPI003514E855
MVRLKRTTDDDYCSIQSHLTEADRCYFIYEYTIGQNYTAVTRGNSVISNLKRSPSDVAANAHFQRHKDRERNTCAQIFRSNIPDELHRRTTFVPIPPSAARNDPNREFDDTLVRMAQQIAGRDGDARELLYQIESTRSSHRSPGNRLSQRELLNVYAVNEDLAAPEPEVIALVDDLLTKGTHFRAASRKLQERFPHARFLGLFIAKAIPNPDSV